VSIGARILYISTAAELGKPKISARKIAALDIAAVHKHTSEMRSRPLRRV